MAHETQPVRKALLAEFEQLAAPEAGARRSQLRSSPPAQNLTRIEQIRRALSKAGGVGLKRWIRVWVDQVDGAIRQALRDRVKLPWYMVFHDAAAPGVKERGWRPPPRYDVDETARVLLRTATFALDDPFLASLWRGAERRSQRVEPLEADEDLDELEDLQDLPDSLGIPDQLADGMPLSIQQQINGARHIMRLALFIQGDLSGDRSFLPLWTREMHDALGRLPEWVAIGLVASDLAGRQVPRLVPVDVETASRFIQEHHSKLPGLNPRGLLYTLGVQVGSRLVAVATVNTPSGRWGGAVDPKNVVELTRVASDGSVLGASSMLVARVLDLVPRTLRGPRREPYLFVTYSLGTEEGTTYKALADKGLRPVRRIKGKTAGGARKRGTRRAYDPLASADKIRWEAGTAASPAQWDLVGGPPGGQGQPRTRTSKLSSVPEGLSGPLARSGRTAIRRGGPSMPVRWLFERGLIEEPVLDFGSGQGEDVQWLRQQGLEADGFDPVHDPEPLPARKKYKTVLCTYVINTLPRSHEARVLDDVQRRVAPGGTAFITVRKDSSGGKTAAGTYQRHVKLDLPLEGSPGSAHIYRLSG